MKYSSLKIWSEPHIPIFKMAALLLPGHCTTNHGWNLSPSHFRSENVTFLRDYDVIIGDSCQNLGKPPENRDFGQFRLVMCIPITKLNVTIAVLFKTSIKACPHPLPHHPPHPHHYPTPTPLPIVHGMSTIKFHLKSFLKETFKSFLKRPLLKETLRQKKFP